LTSIQVHATIEIAEKAPAQRSSFFVRHVSPHANTCAPELGVDVSQL
jgi:hypothetical protein